MAKSDSNTNHEEESTEKEGILQMARGVRDFGPQEKIIRDEIISTIRRTFELYGFNPIETPILERYEVLAAKFAAGEESDALRETFKLTDQGDRKLGLRFDLTVPFCRFVGMNPDMKMPFKKYLMGEVFRDGPIKTGRYRQFMQMDPDIVGTESMLADAEILALSSAIFRKLGFEVDIELNDRKILDGLLEQFAIPLDKRFSAMVVVDKLKKIGTEGVMSELSLAGLSDQNSRDLLKAFSKGVRNIDTLESLKRMTSNAMALEGLQEIEQILNYLDMFGVTNVTFTPSLARGLAYYTGPVFEIFLKDSSIQSSVSGGGRYDKIIGNYLQNERSYPATGISYGVDVIIEAMKEKRAFTKRSVVTVYVIPIKAIKESIQVVQQLRAMGINTDFDLASRGLSKNLAYADAYGIPYVIIIGEKDIIQGQVTVRNMVSGAEEKVKLDAISGYGFQSL